MSRKKLTSLIALLLAIVSYGQYSEAEEILSQAKEGVDSSGYSIIFERIGTQMKRPERIVVAEENEYMPGGYVYADKDKFEFSMAEVQGICDGEIFVMINYTNQIIIVDSVRKDSIYSDKGMKQISELFEVSLKDKKLVKLNDVMFAGDSCYKLHISYYNTQIKDDIDVYYYISKKKKKLKLVAEGLNGIYTVFWIKSIGGPPKRHSYSFGFPNEETTKLKGMKVIDFRYIDNSVSTF